MTAPSFGSTRDRCLSAGVQSRAGPAVAVRRVFPTICGLGMFGLVFDSLREQRLGMDAPLKLNAIEQEHLQELYDAAGGARDELPYTPAFQELVQGFQDRTFKNANPEQVFGALLKYTRSSSNAATDLPPSVVNDDQLKQLKAALSRHLIAGKILPYSDEFKNAKSEFTKAAGLDLSEQD